MQHTGQMRRTVGAALLAGAALSLGACRRGERHLQDAFRLSEHVMPGTTVHVRTVSGDVTVRGIGGQQLDVRGAKRWRRGRARDVRFVSVRHGDDVYLCAIWVRRGGECGGERYRPRPPRILAMFSLFGRRTDMRASFQVAVPPGVRVEARTVNGRVSVTEAAGDVVAETVNGSIRASTRGGGLTLTTVNGSIRARAASLAAHAPVRLETVNGSVRADLPPTLEGDVQLSTVNGRITTDFPLAVDGAMSKREIRGRIGEGGRPIELKTVNGSVELKRLGEPHSRP